MPLSTKENYKPLQSIAPDTEIEQIQLNLIEQRLEGVEDSYPWKFNPEHEMFMGSTNAIEMYSRTLNLGRTSSEFVPFKDEFSSGYKLTNSAIKNNEEIKNLGLFLQSCRENMRFLLEKLKELRSKDPSEQR